MTDCPIDAYVVNCTKNLEMCTEFGHRLPVNDDRSWESNKDMSEHLATAVDAIEAALDDSSQVYVYSDTGRYRAATVMVAYLVRCQDMMMHEAIVHVQSCKRDAFFFEHHFMEALLEFCM
jgi:protein-tyrosine phosphatase